MVAGHSVQALPSCSYNLYDESGKLVSIGYCYECYGIIVNPDLVEKAGHSMDEIKNFDGLKAVVGDRILHAFELPGTLHLESGLAILELLAGVMAGLHGLVRH